VLEACVPYKLPSIVVDFLIWPPLSLLLSIWRGFGDENDKERRKEKRNMAKSCILKHRSAGHPNGAGSQKHLAKDETTRVKTSPIGWC
jgi:hypothetical protein